VSDLAKQCGFVCPGDKDENGVTVKGIVDGNASISGVPSVDGFFQSVINFQNAAKGVAAGIDAQLAAIGADFELDPNAADVGAALQVKLAANLEAGFSLKVEPPVCKADFKAELDAAARCDASVSGGKLEVDCKGGCDVQASADVKCDAKADLVCTVRAPEVECKGECTGSCTVAVTADVGCTGTCNGMCVGTCSAYVKDASGNAQCQGQCTGQCTGTCTADVTADASCKGKCSGECTMTNPSAGCEGGIRAQCKAKANASIKCETQCDGDFEPPMVKAECQARVHAEAKLSVQCTPPHVALNYRIKAAAKLELAAQLRFEAALKSLVEVRLPALKAAVKKSDSVTDAGAELATSAGGALKDAVNATKAKAGIDVKVVFGLGCAANELPNVKRMVDGSTTNLKRSVDAAAKVNAALGV
jgi:hypothetical protein